MISQATKALGLDALYQVLDNWVFRILVVLAGALVLSTFLVGFREDEIVLLFGLQSWSYEGILGMLNIGSGIENPQEIVVGAIVSIVLDWIAGWVGVIFCIAATAFFVPQMLEKGAADVLFHKPLSRLRFYVARYFAGLLFVALLIGLVSGGMYLGLLLVSGYNDPGIPIASLTLTYLFGLIYAVSMLVGVVTRSTVAAILLTTIFFLFNSCVHVVWREIETNELRELVTLGADEEADPSAREADIDSLGMFIRRVNAPLHYALPKTSDATLIAQKLRRAANPPYFHEDGSLVSIFELPGDARAIDAGLPALASTAPDLATLLGEPRTAFLASEHEAKYTLFRRELASREQERRGEMRTIYESATGAARSLEDVVEKLPGVEYVDRALASFGTSSQGTPISTGTVTWRLGGHEYAAVVFRGAASERLYTLWIEDQRPSVESTDERQARLEDLIAHAGEQMGYEVRGSLYEERFTLDSEWKYNPLFSVGSSLAFVLVVLLAGWVKLARIEF